MMTEKTDITKWTYGKLEHIDDGQFCISERMFRENQHLQFTSGKTQIETIEDVAYIFKLLENSAVENSFIVAVKDSIPTVAHIGTGNLSSCTADLGAIRSLYDILLPEKMYFVHNHPSGALVCSKADIALYESVYEMLPGGVLQEGIIINTFSGEFGIFDRASNEKRTMPNNDASENYPIKLYSFDKKVYSKDFNPEQYCKIKGPGDVASFLSSHRLGDRAKMSYIILDRANGIIGNIHTPYISLDGNEKAIASDMASTAVKHCGSSVIIYGDIDTQTHDVRNSVAKIKNNLAKYSGNTLYMLDVLLFNGRRSYYSFSEEKESMITFEEVADNEPQYGSKKAADLIAERYADLLVEKFAYIDENSWTKPWITPSNFPAQNINGNIYNGSNQFFLSLVSNVKGYEFPLFATFQQMTELMGLKVNKGAHGWPVIFYNPYIIERDSGKTALLSVKEYFKLPKEEADKYKLKYTAKVYTVFNIIESSNFKEIYPERYSKLKSLAERSYAEKETSIEKVDLMLQNQSWLCPITSDKISSDAYYSINEDKIVVPKKEQYKDEEQFYSTLFHEMSHSTGSKDRLNRDLEVTDIKKYAMEELIAELSSATMMTITGVAATIKPENLQYLKYWIEAMKEDPKIILSTTAKAAAASNMISEHLGLSLNKGLDFTVDAGQNVAGELFYAPKSGVVAEDVPHYAEKELIDGVFETRNTDGQLSSRINFKDGKKDGLCEFWDDGKLFARVNFKNDKLDGEWEVYRNDKLWKKRFYINGKRNLLREFKGLIEGSKHILEKKFPVNPKNVTETNKLKL